MAHTHSQIATHASIIRSALTIAGVRAHVHSEEDRISVSVSGGHSALIAAAIIAERRRGCFALVVSEEVASC